MPCAISCSRKTWLQARGRTILGKINVPLVLAVYLGTPDILVDVSPSHPSAIWFGSGRVGISSDVARTMSQLFLIPPRSCDWRQEPDASFGCLDTLCLEMCLLSREASNFQGKPSTSQGKLMSSVELWRIMGDNHTSCTVSSSWITFEESREFRGQMRGAHHGVRMPFTEPATLCDATQHEFPVSALTSLVTGMFWLWFSRVAPAVLDNRVLPSRRVEIAPARQVFTSTSLVPRMVTPSPPGFSLSLADPRGEPGSRSQETWHGHKKKQVRFFRRLDSAT